MDKKIRKIQAKIRKMTYHEKLILMDWFNAWYEDIKEQARLDYQQWLEEE